MNRPKYESEDECDRCGEIVPDDYNETPSGQLLCDDCLSMDDVFED